MRTLAKILIAGVILSLPSCVDNEVTFVVKHMKTQPDSECSVTVGDDVAAFASVDVSLAQRFGSHFLVSNATMARGDNETLSADANAILIEGSETRISGGGLLSGIGATSYVVSNDFIEPESEKVVYASVISRDLMRQIADAVGCVRWDEQYSSDIWDQIISGSWPPNSVSSSTVTASVRYLGHTQGGIDVETQWFSFNIDLCCNCLIDFGQCRSPCNSFCTEPEEFGGCLRGVSGKGNSDFDCRALFSHPENWTDSNGAAANCEDSCS